ncbi:HNH endonuclease [Rhizobium leguminosarum]|nr:HNH endonuclease [Rhizobium leguminosarum]
MWKVPLPARGETDINVQLDAALIQADGTVDYALSDPERQTIHELYAIYDQLLGEPNPSLDPEALSACKDALHDAYGQVQKGGRLKKMRGDLLRAVRECPLCGAAPATTLDHHLPRAQYKSLALNPRNLVPSCQPCNRAKGTLVPVAGQGMIHAYFHALPAATFLRATSSYIDGALAISFDIDAAAAPSPLYERLTSQLTRLNLDERLTDSINIMMFTLKPSLEMFRGLANERVQIQEYLRGAARSYNKDFALNHWRAAVVLSLSECDPFLDDPWTYLDKPLILTEAMEDEEVD